MDIFLDTADREEIKKWSKTGIIDGVTTNPSHLSKQGANTREVLLDICRMVDGDVSIEVVEKDPEAVYRQAKEINALAPNVVVKIPFSFQYLGIIDRLVDEDVDLNITLVFSAIQALMVAKLDVKYISPFIGRLDDVGVLGTEMLEDIMEIQDNYDFDSEILAASIRSVRHWHEVATFGVDVVTVPPAVLEKAVLHPLTTLGIAKFDADWQALNKPSLLG